MAQENYDYDLVVIGGGSGGLAAGKEAALFGAKVAVLDYVAPSTQGTQWGLGGTCVNVGCIPKKLMHKASTLGEDMHDAASFGWTTPESPPHNWEKMVTEVGNHIKSLNFGYRTQLRKQNINYLNAKGELKSAHEVHCTFYKKREPNVVDKEETITARHVLIAVGGRPRLPKDVPGAAEHCITSDDVFWQPKPPGKTLVVGASYVALECAGFIKGLGYPVTVMVRSILLRGFDQDMANRIGTYMEKIQGVEFIRGELPTAIEKQENGQLKVSYGEGKEEVFDTVLYAIGRDPSTQSIGLEAAGVKVDGKTGKIPVDKRDCTNVPNIHAIGDVALNPNPLLRMLELTPVAIKSGRLLMHRLFNNSTTVMDYKSVATTVFTPLEYGAVGMSEEQALDTFDDDVEVYHSNFVPLEWTVPGRDINSCYCKVIVNKGNNEQVIGMHYLGPNAGEVIQGFTLAVKAGITKEDLDSVVGIHPTVAEEMLDLKITKSSGEDPTKTGC